LKLTTNTRTKATPTNAATAQADAAKLASATKKVIDKAMADAIAKRFVPMAGGEMAEFSAQIAYAETVLGQILIDLEIDGMNGNTFAVYIETGKYARCYGRHTKLRRLDNGQAVISVVVHISIFGKPIIEFVTDLLHAFSHSLAVARTTNSDKLEFGMGMSAQHNSKFTDEFQMFGSTTEADRTSKQNLPDVLSPETVKAIERLTVDASAVILTGDAAPKPNRTPAVVLRLACPTDAKHFATSNIEKRYKGKRPVIDLDCGKCKTKISVAGYENHKPTK
jgi:hypothetical protein